MNKQTLRLAIGAALGTIVSIPAFAQQSDDDTAQTVVVTGTRISPPSDFGNSSPVDIIARHNI
jgi:hypothetical protein